MVRKSNPADPVSRVAAKVRYSNNNDLLRADSVQDTVGKAMHETSSDIKANHGPHVGALRNVPNRTFNLRQEVVTEAGGLRFVIPRGVQHFLLCRIKKTDLFHLILSRASRKTSSASLPEMLPFLYSSYRLAASSTQRRSYSASSRLSRLEMRCSASSARC